MSQRKKLVGYQALVLGEAMALLYTREKKYNDMLHRDRKRHPDLFEQYTSLIINSNDKLQKLDETLSTIKSICMSDGGYKMKRDMEHTLMGVMERLERER